MKRFEEIAEHPRLYQTIDAIRPGYRRSVYGVHSLYYRETQEGVTIARILRGQDPKEALAGQFYTDNKKQRDRFIFQESMYG